MQKILDTLIENTYQLNLPLPVVSVTELNLSVQKGTIYKGAIEIINSAEGRLIGLVESRSKILKINDDVIKGDKCVINFQINSKALNIGRYEDTILITYNGGEILIPANIEILKVKGTQDEKQSKGWRAKEQKDKISFTFNQKSYNPSDTGTLTIINPRTSKIHLKINNEEGFIQFNETEFEVSETKTVEFSFKITKLDRMLGRIPLKTNPSIELKFSMNVITETEQDIKNLSIYVTDLSNLPTKYKITSDRSYRRLTTEIFKSFSAISLSSSKEKNIELLIDKLGGAINYNKTNIYLRLLYCYITLEFGKKNLALKEINNLDRYLLYYDKEHMEVSDILMLFLEVYKGEVVQELINRWIMIDMKHWVKVLLKTKYITNKIMCYESYKNIYISGNKRFFIFLAAVLQINQIPFVPNEHDIFYKALLLWALRKREIGPKWLKKLGNSYSILLKYDNINSIIAEKLYDLDKSKSMLMLISSVYISENKLDKKALIIYERALSEKLHINDLEASYIKASYNCDTLINFNYIKIIFNVEILEPKYRDFFYLNLLIQEEQYKNLFKIHVKNLNQLSAVSFKDLMVPTVLNIKANYVNYLIITKQSQLLLMLYEAGKLNNLSQDITVSLIKIIYDVKEELAISLSIEAFSKGCYEPAILDIVGNNYTGTINSLIGIYNKLANCGYYSVRLEEQILYKGILTRSSPKKVMHIFLDYTGHGANRKIHDLMLSFIAGQIIVEEVQPPIGIIKLLEDEVSKSEDIALSLSLLKSYIKCEEKDEVLINTLIHRFVNQGIIFSWFTQLVSEEVLGERIRIHHYFEYNSKPNQIIDFYYRLDNESTFNCVRMKHVALGMYIANIVLFYNERIQYYINEIDEEGKTDIKLSDVYVKNDLVEVENAECLFDLINTVEISKIMNDENSIEQSIDNYINFTKQEIEKATIL